MERVDPQAFQRFATWIESLLIPDSEGPRLLNIDGKRVRRSRDRQHGLGPLHRRLHERESRMAGQRHEIRKLRLWLVCANRESERASERCRPANAEHIHIAETGRQEPLL